jgi:DNA-binding IclR family transcriptional regulator
LTICDPKALRRELGQVRERGWAYEAGELDRLRASIAAPIVDRTGGTVGAMGIFGSPDRLSTAHMPRRELLTQVREHASAVSRELGASP